jgi:hypothetical protein
MEKERVLNRLIILLLCLPNANVLEKAKGIFHEVMTIASLKGCALGTSSFWVCLSVIWPLELLIFIFWWVQFCDVSKVVIILKKI